MYDNRINENSIFNTKTVRKNFVSKVFSIVGLQLTITALIVLLINSNEKLASVSNIMVVPFAIASIVSLITLICFKNIAQRVPTNYILLSIITIAESLILEIFLRDFKNDSILSAVFLTGSTVVLMGIIALKTDVDLISTKFFLYFSLGHLVLILVSMLIFSLNSIIFSIFTAIASSIYIIIDIQLIMGNKNKQLSIDDYVIASLYLYLDIILLFKKILEIFGEKKTDKKRRN